MSKTVLLGDTNNIYILQQPDPNTSLLTSKRFFSASCFTAFLASDSISLDDSDSEMVLKDAVAVFGLDLSNTCPVPVSFLTFAFVASDSKSLDDSDSELVLEDVVAGFGLDLSNSCPVILSLLTFAFLATESKSLDDPDPELVLEYDMTVFDLFLSFSESMFLLSSVASDSKSVDDFDSKPVSEDSVAGFGLYLLVSNSCPERMSFLTFAFFVSDSLCLDDSDSELVLEDGVAGFSLDLLNSSPVMLSLLTFATVASSEFVFSLSLELLLPQELVDTFKVLSFTSLSSGFSFLCSLILLEVPSSSLELPEDLISDRTFECFKKVVSLNSCDLSNTVSIDSLDDDFNSSLSVAVFLLTPSAAPFVSLSDFFLSVSSLALSSVKSLE